MKKLCVFMAIILLFLLATGCKKQPANHSNSVADPTAFANPTEETGTIEKESVKPTDGQNEPAVVSIEKEFYNLINNDMLYRRALGCTFEKPEEINAYFFFYTGVGANEQATDEERALILDAYKKKNPNQGDPEEHSSYYIRLPVAKINEGLSVLGVTLEDIKIPDRWAYIEKTDAYYFWVRDAYGVGRWSVTKVEKDTEGKVTVYWKPEGSHYNTATGEFMKNAKMVMTLQEQPDGTYRVLSNVPQE